MAVGRTKSINADTDHVCQQIPAPVFSALADLSKAGGGLREDCPSQQLRELVASESLVHPLVAAHQLSILSALDSDPDPDPDPD